MQEDVHTQPLPAVRPTSSPLRTFFITLIAFCGGALVVAASVVTWLSWRGDLVPLLTRDTASGQTASASTAASPNAQKLIDNNGLSASGSQLPPNATEALTQQSSSLSIVESRVAFLENRISRLALQTEAAAGNATRAESLLVAFAARRMLDKGEALGYLETHLKLRFGNSHPAAVRTLIQNAHNPITLDNLLTRLDILAPVALATSNQTNTWSRVGTEFRNLFMVRSDSQPPSSAQARLERVQLLLAKGEVETALKEIERLPGHGDARITEWIVDARRYAENQGALDLLETAAIHEPRRLTNDQGQLVQQLSPATQPAPVPAPSVTAAATPTASATATQATQN